MKKTLKERFDEKWKENKETGCWEWIGGIFNKNGGYAMINIPIGEGNTVKLAHRISYELHKGPIPKGYVIRHTCNNPCCVNPDHLVNSTRKECADIKYERGRANHAKGSEQGNSKLTEEQVISIFKDNRTQQTIADQYGINRVAVSHIKRGKNWGWLTSSIPKQ